MEAAVLAPPSPTAIFPPKSLRLGFRLRVNSKQAFNFSNPVLEDERCPAYYQSFSENLLLIPTIAMRQRCDRGGRVLPKPIVSLASPVLLVAQSVDEF